MKSKEKKSNKNALRLIGTEIKKNIRIVLRGESRVILLLTLVFPLIYLFFMSLVFTTPNMNYGMAIVIPDFKTDEDLNQALETNSLPNTQEFLNYLNDNDLVGPTIVKSHIEYIGTSQEQFIDELRQQDISLVVILPKNFEHIIKVVKKGSWNGGEIIIELQCLNVNEDYLKNIYFCFERKLKAYYDNVLNGQVEVTYIYKDAHPNRPTLPRIWTIGSGAIVFLSLISSMILSAAFIFNEKNDNMRPELALASKSNQNYTYLGKIISALILSFLVDFILGTLIVFLWIGLPFPADLRGFLLISIGTLSLGAAMGSLIGIIIPEQVFTIPVSAFLVIGLLFLCGGFIGVEMYGGLLETIVNLIPFTYCNTITFSTLLTGGAIDIFQVIGLILYIFLFIGIGIILYQKYIVKSN